MVKHPSRAPTPASLKDLSFCYLPPNPATWQILIDEDLAITRIAYDNLTRPVILVPAGHVSARDLRAVIGGLRDDACGCDGCWDRAGRLHTMWMPRSCRWRSAS
jgi:hypothetical protein